MDAIALWDRTETRRLVIAVFGMACEHCRDTVATVLEDVEGVRSAEVDLDEKRALVDVEAGTDAEPILEAVRSVGYEPRRTPSPG